MAVYHLKTPFREEEIRSLSVGDVVSVRIKSVDLKKKRISLTMKSET